MNSIRKCVMVVCSLALGACATSPIPSSAMKDVDPSVGFGVLKAQPDVYKGRAVELAGRVVDIQLVQNGTLIVAQSLPMKNNRPVETLGEIKREMIDESVEPNATFAVLYPTTIAKSEFEFGDKVLVVGKVEEAKKGRPYLVAGCVHVWKTGAYPISEYEDWADLGLSQKTYCAQ